MLRFFLFFLAIEAGILFLSPAETDLQARWFGVGVGLFLASASTLIGHLSRVFRQKRLKKTGIFAFSLLTGYAAGALIDGLYATWLTDTCAVFQWLPLPLVTFLFVRRFVRRFVPRNKPERTQNAEILPASTPNLMLNLRCNWDEIVLEMCVLSTFLSTLYLSMPAMPLKPQGLHEGIYIYANDVVYDYPIINIITSRIPLATHSGLCLITRNPEKLKRGYPRQQGMRLRFTALDDGWMIQDLNLDVRNTNCLANYGSCTRLDDRPYPFDIEHFKFYQQGRSTNDRLKPAIRLQPLNVSDPISKWLKILDFRDKINAQYPDGFIYSPIPHNRKHVRLYNCNTVTVGIADEFLNRGAEAEKLSALPLSVGKQRVSDGRALMKDYRSDNFAERIARERLESFP